MATTIAQTMRKKASSQPLKSYLWRVSLPNLTGRIKHSGVLTSIQAPPVVEFSPSNMADISSRITSISIPNYSISTERVSHGNSFWQAAGSLEVNAMTIEIMDYEDAFSLQYLESWKHLIIHQTKKQTAAGNGYKDVHGAYTYNPPHFYKHPITVYFLDSTKQDLIKFNYYNCFPTSIEDHSNDYEGSDFVKYSVSFAVDYMDHEVIGVDDTEALKLAAKELYMDSGFTYSNRQVGNAVNDLLSSILYD